MSHFHTAGVSSNLIYLRATLAKLMEAIWQAIKLYFSTEKIKIRQKKLLIYVKIMLLQSLVINYKIKQE